MIEVDEFNAYCKGKRIAVVGEAQSMIGLGNGPAIDDHDLIIRFSESARVPERYLADVGYECHVWCCAINDMHSLWLCWERLRDRIKYALWPWVNLNTALPEFASKLVWLPRCHIVDLSTALGTWSTNGLAALVWLWKNTDYGSIDVYGFDFLRTGCWTVTLRVPQSEIQGHHNGANERAWVLANMARDTTFHGAGFDEEEGGE